MSDPSDVHEGGNEIPFTEFEFQSLSTEELLKRTSQAEKRFVELTSKQLIKLNEQRIFDCARIGVSKTEAAKLILNDPRNRGRIKMSTILRDMNDVAGEWKELVRKARSLEATRTVTRPAVSGSSSHEVMPNIRGQANPLLDQNFNEGDLL